MPMADMKFILKVALTYLIHQLELILDIFLTAMTPLRKQNPNIQKNHSFVFRVLIHAQMVNSISIG